MLGIRDRFLLKAGISLKTGLDNCNQEGKKKTPPKVWPPEEGFPDHYKRQSIVPVAGASRRSGRQIAVGALTMADNFEKIKSQLSPAATEGQPMTCALLVQDLPLQGLLSLARLLGLNPALVLQQIHYWTHTHHAVERDGRSWISISAKAWQTQDFPFWSIDTLRRAIKELEHRGVLLTASFSKQCFDQTRWYSIDYEALDRLAIDLGKSITEGQP